MKRRWKVTLGQWAVVWAMTVLSLVYLAVVSPVRFFDLGQPPWVVFSITVGLQFFMLVPLVLNIALMVPSEERPSHLSTDYALSGIFGAPLWEELLYRAPLLYVLAWFPQYVVLATAVSSGLFALGHRHQFPTRGMGVFVLWKTAVGWLLAWCALSAGNIIWSAAAHSITNGTFYTLQRLFDRKVERLQKLFLWRRA